jgi:hypothetical protein
VKEPLLKQSRVIFSFALMVVTMAIIGCGAPAIQVPQNSKLLYYGFGGSFTGTRPMGAGRVFLVDETQGNRVVSVMAVSGDQPFSFNHLNTEHKYRVYFEPDATLAMPGTQPAR